MITIERPINTFIRLPGDVAPKNDATMSPPNTEANPRPQPIADWLPKQEVLEIKQESAVIGERPEDVPTKPIVRGATLMMLVAPEKGKARAKAKAKERVRVREADLDQARPAAEQHRETVPLLACS